MKALARCFAMVTGLVLLFATMPSWGQPVCALPGCNPTASDANNNTAGGTAALTSVNAIEGFNNTAFGNDALRFNILGDNNTAIGSAALSSNTTGGTNTACGYVALFSNTVGGNNTASGGAALFLNATGSNNTADGYNALFSNDTGNFNTATGFQALHDNTAGNNNTAVGARALTQSLGTKNIGIGYQAGLSLVTGSNNIFIGNQGAGDESQTIRVGTAQTRTFIAGIGNAIVTGSTVEVDTNTGQLGISGVSSARYKRDIEPMGVRSAGVLQLRPVTFAYQQDAPGIVRYGLVAEEVRGVYPELVTQTAAGEPLAVRYQELIPMLLNELQREHQEVAALRKELAEVTTLRQEVAELRALVGQRR